MIGFFKKKAQDSSSIEDDFNYAELLDRVKEGKCLAVEPESTSINLTIADPEKVDVEAIKSMDKVMLALWGPAPNRKLIISFNTSTRHKAYQEIVRLLKEQYNWKKPDDNDLEAYFNAGTEWAMQFRNDKIIKKVAQLPVEIIQFKGVFDNSEALFYEGVYWEHGEFGGNNEYNYSKATNCYQKAAKQGSVDAMYRLGRLYDKGIGMQQEYEAAMYWYREAARHGSEKAKARFDVLMADPDINYYVGMRYLNGENDHRNFKNAFAWLKKAALGGSLDAQKQLADYILHHKHNDYYEEPDKTWFEKAAELGDDTAQLLTGICYERGYNIEQDYAQAVFWYEKAAMQNIGAAVNCAELYYKMGKIGDGYAKAAYWCDFVAKKIYEWPVVMSGLYHAIYINKYEMEETCPTSVIQIQKLLARLYLEGKGVEQDYVRAAYWFEIAARQGDEQARQMLEEKWNTSWDLNQKDIDKIYKDCIVEDTHQHDDFIKPVNTYEFELREDEGKAKLFYHSVKLVVYSRIIDYMYGLLMEYHREPDRLFLGGNDFIAYNNRAWTYDFEILERFEVLGIANGLISSFYMLENGTFVAKRNPWMIATLYSDDPEYPAWLEQVYKKEYKHRDFFSGIPSLALSLRTRVQKGEKPSAQLLMNLCGYYWDLPPKSREQMAEVFKEEIEKANTITEEEKKEGITMINALPAMAKKSDYISYLAYSDEDGEEYCTRFINNILDEFPQSIKDKINELQKKEADSKIAAKELMNIIKKTDSSYVFHLLKKVYKIND